jgi:hypothetical protein
MSKRILYPGIYIAILLLTVALGGIRAQQRAGGAAQAAVQIDPDDIGGVVTSTKGPEAGVWVIAETKELKTGFSRSVVTDDQGRYVIPDLPKANYQVWVRGYGLVDSDKVTAAPGKLLNLTAKVAPDEKAAAEIYPSNYWFAMLKVPQSNEFPIQEAGAGSAQNAQTYFRTLKTDSCISCHQLGNKPTREFPNGLKPTDHLQAWFDRVKYGPDGSNMDGVLTQLGRQYTGKNLADWTERIAKGETPFEKPPRPQGAERNVVVTQWDWADGREYFHDVVASDKRNPTVNPNGLVFGLHENSSDHLTWVDPVNNSWGEETIPRSPKAGEAAPGGRGGYTSPYWGNEVIWNQVTNGHSNEMDQMGRVWNTTNTGVGNDMLPYCSDGNLNQAAKLAPIPAGRGRKFSIFDPKTKKWDFADSCFGSFHLNMAYDPPNNSMVSGSGGYVGWVSTKVWAETGDINKAQTWTDLVVDTNGNGKRDEYNAPAAAGGRGAGRGGAAPAVAAGAPAPAASAPASDPTKDTKIGGSCYAVMVSPVDNTVWCTLLGSPGSLIRVAPGANPPSTALTEIYNVPAPGFGPRGGDVDKDGVAWTVLSSGHLASFDRRKCKGPLNGPDADKGNKCPEGWSFYKVPGPNFKGDVPTAAADSNYYNWSDKYNSLGLGENVQIATSNEGGALLALVNGQWVVLRVPYPLGFYAKSINGRIDDAKAGWKGRGLWSGWANRNPWHNEGSGKGTTSKAVHFQVRPNPLAH